MPHDDDALVDALLPARAEEATPEELERAAALCQKQADKVRGASRGRGRARADVLCWAGRRGGRCMPA